MVGCSPLELRAVGAYRWRDEPQCPASPPARWSSHRYQRRTILEHPDDGVLPFNGDAPVSRRRFDTDGQAGVRWRYSNSPARRSHAFWSRVWLVRCVSVSRHAVALGPWRPQLPVRSGQGCGVVRAIHLDGDVPGGHPPSPAPTTSDQRTLVDSAHRTFSVRRNTNRGVDRQGLR